MKRLLFICLITPLYFSCSTYDSFRTEVLAKQYCNCLNDPGLKEDPIRRQVYCDSLMKGKNRFLDMYSETFENPDYFGSLSKETRDSISVFVQNFMSKVGQSCPNTFYRDSAMKRKFHFLQSIRPNIPYYRHCRCKCFRLM